MSLVLTRKNDEALSLNVDEMVYRLARDVASRARCGENDQEILESIRLVPITIRVTSLSRSKVRLAVDAPSTVAIVRSEIRQEAPA